MATERIDRDIYCVHYSKCLERAARMGQKYIGCETCPHCQQGPLDITPVEVEQCRCLWRVVLCDLTAAGMRKRRSIPKARRL